MNIENEIKVSVCVVTYNQEKYIAECLESLVNQVTNFKYEIIVGEDCSTDTTRAIVQSYVDKYPDLIVPLFYEMNIGGVENVKRVYKKARGKYISHIDGDDLALQNKLQKQYDILENNKSYSICAHNMKAINSFGLSDARTYKYYNEDEKFSLIHLYLNSPLFIHSSKMFRNDIVGYIDNLDANALDLEVHIEQAKQGDIIVLKEELGAYRQFVGITYQKKVINKMIPNRVISVFESINTNLFSLSERELIRERYSNVLFRYSVHYLLYNDIKNSKLFLKDSISKKKTFFNILFLSIYIFPRSIRFILVFFKKNRGGIV